MVKIFRFYDDVSFFFVSAYFFRFCLLYIQMKENNVECFPNKQTGESAMDAFVQKVVDRMACLQLIKPEEQEDYIYFIELALEKVIAMSAIFLMAFFMNKVLEMMLFLVSYTGIRKYAGGYHCKTFLGCYLLSLGVAYLCISPFSKKWYLTVRNPVLFTLLAICVILFIGAVNHPDMHWDEEELHNAKNMARSIALLQGGIVLSLWYLGLFQKYVFYMMEGIVVSALSMLVARIIRQEVRE